MTRNRLLLDSKDGSPTFILYFNTFPLEIKNFFFLSLTALCSVGNFGCHSADFLAGGLQMFEEHLNFL